MKSFSLIFIAYGYVFGAPLKRMIACLSCSTAAKLPLERPGNPNLAMQGIKNMRDFHSALATIKPNVIYRTACPSKATDDDIASLQQQRIELGSFIDLRSPREIAEDAHIQSSVYSGTNTYTYQPETNSLSPSDSHVLSSSSAKERHFVSLLNERMVGKAVFKRMKTRHKLRTLLLLPLSKFSRKAKSALRQLFLSYFNRGGLYLLNEIMVDYSGQSIVQVLKTVAFRSSLPYATALYCTAGKDRTGLVSMLVLSLLGASDEEIMRDYAYSHDVYKDLNDHTAMVASLRQADVDPNVFLSSPPEVILHTIQYIRRKYGSVQEYVEKFGFTQEDRERLRKNLLIAGPPDRISISKKLL